VVQVAVRIFHLRTSTLISNYYSELAATTASATTACSPARFEPATSSASDNCSPLPRLRLEARTRTPTARPKHLRADARVAAAAWSSLKRSKARALRDPNRAGSGSTPHDRHSAFRFSIPIAFAPARRSTTALTSPRPKIPFERGIDAKPAHALDRRASYSPVPSTRLRLIAPRSHPRDLPKISKSP
jgi:hypothetical protein